ncbi:uncharacterized protein LOC133300215 [Gastrolobium bilobum]|uniref:uncharacterized protein LOC133300215 n=1 Tax=Gastrolobium bilobum TaxID=150636 RepID=UPI002AB22F33|nr:uncharacterized protein LOC133300215 [Gastrolobium bilobum]
METTEKAEISPEEFDNLHQSKKKYKGDDAEFSHDQAMVPREDEWIREGISFKEMLMRHNGEWWSDEEDILLENGTVEEEKEENGSKEKQPEVTWEIDGDGRTNFKLPADFKKKAWRPWKKAIYVKLLGKKLSLTFMKKRLENMWAREGQVFITDVENRYLLVRFSCQKDLDHALTAGPWGIGNWLGKFIKVDAATTSLARGRFARICVELDLTKPLNAEYKLEGRLKHVEYEGLHLVCYSCGQYGHRLEMCSKKCPTENAEPSQDQNRKEQGGGVDTTMSQSCSSGDLAKENTYGPWMLVNRQKRFNRINDFAQKGKKENHNGQPTRRQSSRFNALAYESNDAEDGKEENLNVEINEEESIAEHNSKNRQGRKKEIKMQFK